MTEHLVNRFLDILKEELLLAMGCTEPIALAYAAARARQVLGATPEHIYARLSGNMIKNVRCVSIPNSNGMTGIEPACVLGAFGGDATRGMEVLEAVTPEARGLSRLFIQNEKCTVEYLQSDIPLHFILALTKDEDVVEIEVRYSHTNIVRIQKNDTVLYMNDKTSEAVLTDRSELSIENIKEFSDNVDISLIKPLVKQQIRCNMEIAYEGMSGDYGLGIGKVIKNAYPDSTVTRMRAYAAAASEARMDGCDMPVVINSGSGNQGIASTVPVIVFARENAISEERLYRALVFSSLLTIYQKEFIGKLSAFCGAVSASCAAGAAVTYLVGGTLAQIKATVANTLADIPGILCDGAKTSCAAKIASAVDAAMLAHTLAMQNKAYAAHSGILKDDAGETISCVGYIGKVGMRETDREIINMMLENQ